MGRFILSLAAALALVAGFSIATSAAVDHAKFEREFKGAKTPLLKSKVALQLDGRVSNLKSWELVLHDPYWNVRAPIVEFISKLSSSEDRAKVAAHMATVKDVNARHQVVYAYGQAWLNKPEDWAPLHKMLRDEKESLAIKATILRAMSQWQFRRPPSATINHSEEERKEIEAIAEGINEVAQPIVKGNFKAYMDFLKWMQTDPKFSKQLDPKKKDNAARLLLWLTVYGLEKLSSEEGTENWDAWDIFWQKVENENLNLQYRYDDDRSRMEIGDVAANVRTAVRKKARRETGVHLLMMPDDDCDLYFAPYEREFIQSFKISSFIMPDGAKWGRKNDDQSYFYPIAKVAEIFKEHRRAQQGGMFGMLCVGDASYLAMEYAKFDPDGCAFILCVGAWASNNAMAASHTTGENSKRLDIKNYYLSLWYQDPNGIRSDPEKDFHRECGELSHRFANPFNPDIYYVRDKIQEAPGVASSGLQPIIDDAYAFKGKHISVPALFIYGKQDEASGAKRAQSELSKMFTNAKFVTMENTALMPWLEDPIGFMDHFELFMKEKKVWERIDAFKAKEAAAKEGGNKKK